MKVDLGRLKNIFLHNWSLKVLALILAFLTFYGIRSVTSDKVVYDLPLRIDAGEWIAMHDQQKSVSVTFRGSDSDLKKLDPNRMEVLVSTRVDQNGSTRRIMIGTRDVYHRAGPGVRAVNIVPESVQVSFDRRIEKIVPVAPPVVTGRPLIGKAEVDYYPREVKLRGPSRSLAGKKIVEVERIDIEGCKASFSKQVAVFCPGEIGKYEIEPSEINIEVNIVTESASRQLEKKKIMAIVEQNGSYDVVCEPDVVSVFLYGSEKVLDGVQPDMVKVFVDCTSLDVSKSHRLPVNVHLPAGMNATATADPGKVKVIFKVHTEKEDQEKVEK